MSARDDDTGQLDGLGQPDPTKEALAAYARSRLARRGFAPLPEGGLFDDTARLQKDLFE